MLAVAGPAKVLLVALPVTSDFATQEALGIAKKHDPAGDRTIGVITKIDVPREHNVVLSRMRTAKQKGFALKLGYVAVCLLHPDLDLRDSSVNLEEIQILLLETQGGSNVYDIQLS